jgi:alpha-glucosidase
MNPRQAGQTTPEHGSDQDRRAGSDWWRGAAIYQVYPRSFQDTNGDGIGDLPGITARLPYIADLGVDAIWLSPFFQSPMKDFGYDVSDFRKVDPIFGTLADFDLLVARAHGLGVKVLIDQVLSHTSDQHAWFRDSQKTARNERSDWYVWADARPDGTPPNNWQSVFGGSAWAWAPRRRQYYLHNFLASQPDLNFHHRPVQDQLLEEVRFWMERGVDGFRFDACNFHFHDARLRSNPPVKSRHHELSTVKAGNPYGFQIHKHDKTQPENLAFLQRLRVLMDQYGAVSVGEVGDEDSLPTMAQYTEGGDKLHMAYGFKLLTDEFTAGRIKDVVGTFERLIQPGGGYGCWSFSNHDCVRVATRWGLGVEAPAFAKVLLAVLGTLGGSFCVYQGEELGLPEAKVPFDRLQDPYGIPFWPDFKGRDGCRTPMPWTPEAPNAGFSAGEPWLPLPPEHLALSVASQSGQPGSVLTFFKAFLAWRKGQQALRRGSVRFLKTAEPVLALRRQVESEELIAVFNLGAAPATYTLPPRTRPLQGHGLAAGLVAGRQLTLPPWGGFYGQLS